MAIKRWEYAQHRWPLMNSELLDHEGKYGWELVAVTGFEEEYQDFDREWHEATAVFVFKREATDGLKTPCSFQGLPWKVVRLIIHPQPGSPELSPGSSEGSETSRSSVPASSAP